MEFFVAGGTLRPDAPSYVERRADTELYQGLSRGEYCYVLTSRQMGKSSLMVRTAVRLRAEGAVVALVDLTALGQNLPPEQWYQGLLRHIARHVDPTGRLEEETVASRSAHTGVSPVERWVTILREVILPRARGPLVVFLDEIDFVRSLPFATDELFAAIRESHNRRAVDPAFERITFCLLGVATPSDLIRDPRATPFNIGRRVELTDFTPEEARPLALGLALGNALPASGGDGPGLTHPTTVPTPAAERLLQRILHWTGGHPYLTQRLCRALAETHLRKEDRGKRKEGDPVSLLTSLSTFLASPVSLFTSLSTFLARPVSLFTSLSSFLARTVDRLCVELFLSPEAREQDDNLLFARESALRSGSGPAEVLDLYGQVLRSAAPWPRRRGPCAERESPAGAALRLAGLVRIHHGRLQLRNRIYHHVFDFAWVRENMPGAELRRQRAAFHRGLMRAGIVSAAILSMMGGLAVAAVHNEHRALSVTRKLNTALAEKSEALAQAGRALAEATTQRGFARQAEAKAAAGESAAVAARTIANHQRNLASSQAAAAGRARNDAVRQKSLGQSRLAHLYVANGNHLAEQGDILGALPLYVQAARADGQDPRAASDDRLRIASVLERAPRLVQFFSHGGPVTGAVISPDGRLLVTGGEDGAARVWSLDTGRLAFPPLRHPGRILHLAISKDGRLLATAAFDGTARAWSLATGQPASPILDHPRPVSDCEFDPDGRRLLTISGEHWLTEWDLATGRQTATAGPVTDRLRHCEFSPDGRSFLTTTCTEDSPLSPAEAQIWDASTGTRPEAPIGFRVGIPAASFSPDGRRLAIADMDGVTRFWNPESLLPEGGVMRHSGAVTSLCYSPDGRYAATASRDWTARIWDARTGEPVGVPMQHADRVDCVAFSPRGDLLVTGSRDGTAHVWNTANGAPASPPLPNGEAVRFAAFAAEGQSVVTVTAGGLCKVWDLRTSERGCAYWPALPGPTHTVLSADARHAASVWGTNLRLVQPDCPGRSGELLKFDQQIAATCFSPDSKQLALGVGPNVLLLDPVSGTQRGALCVGIDNVTSVAFSGDGSVVGAGTGFGLLYLWDLHTQRQLARIHLGTADFSSLSLNRDGRLAVGGRGEGSGHLWDRKKGILAHFPVIGARDLIAVFSPDSRRLLTISAGRLSQWDTATGRRLGSDSAGLPGNPHPRPSPIGARMVILNGTAARILDTTTGKFVGGEFRHVAPVISAALSPDGRRLATGCADATVRQWDVITGGALAAAGKLAGPVTNLAYSPDGSRLAGFGGGTARLWSGITGEALAAPWDQFGLVQDAGFTADGCCLAVVLADGGVRSIEMTPDASPLNSLDEIAGALSGGGLSEVESASLTGTWERLRDRYPALFRPAGEDLNWHRLAAERCDQLHQWAAAVAHLDVLIQANPHEFPLFERKARADAELERWGEAAASFQRARELGSGDLLDEYNQAVAEAKAGDLAGYAKTCAGMLDRHTQPRDTNGIDLSTWICAIAPGALPEYARPIRLVQQLLVDTPKSEKVESWKQSLGVLLLRAGRGQEALPYLQRVQNIGSPGDQVVNGLFFALCLQKTGAHVQAREALALALQKLDREEVLGNVASSEWSSRAELALLRTEAEREIGK